MRQRNSLAFPGPYKKAYLHSGKHKVTYQAATQNYLILDVICSIVYSAFVLHRRADLWGPDGNRLRCK